MVRLNGNIEFVPYRADNAQTSKRRFNQDDIRRLLNIQACFFYKKLLSIGRSIGGQFLLVKGYYASRKAGPAGDTVGKRIIITPVKRNHFIDIMPTYSGMSGEKWVEGSGRAHGADRTEHLR
jgi:hypothetical protein